MKNQKSYSEKLRDPRWQKKRLEVLEAAEWKCHSCGKKDKELHVHHPYYLKNTDPWDHPWLVALCKDCHEQITEAGNEICQAISVLPSVQALRLARLFSAVSNQAEGVRMGMNIPMFIARLLAAHARILSNVYDPEQVESAMIPTSSIQDWET